MTRTVADAADGADGGAGDRADGADETIRVEAGRPTADETAILVAVLRASAATARDAAASVRPVSEWARPAGRLRAPIQPRPEGWRRSGLPR